MRASPVVGTLAASAHGRNIHSQQISASVLDPAGDTYTQDPSEATARAQLALALVVALSMTDWATPVVSSSTMARAASVQPALQTQFQLPDGQPSVNVGPFQGRSGADSPLTPVLRESYMGRGRAGGMSRSRRQVSFRLERLCHAWQACDTARGHSAGTHHHE